MRISPISFGINYNDRIVTSSEEKDYVPTTVRHNSLADLEFDIIADTIRSQNLKNQMNVRLMNLKRNLNNCMAQGLYKQ